MAWAETHQAVRDVVLLILGTAIMIHELFITAVERPIILGAGLSCLGLSLVARR